MRTFKKLLIWFGIIIVVIVVGGFVGVSYFLNSFKPQLEQKISENTGFETIIDGPISLKILPGISFVVHDLKVVSNETYLLRSDQIEIAINYKQLLSKQMDITALHFVHPQVYVARNGDGTFNYDIPMASLQSPASQTSHTNQINLSAFSISDGQLLYLDHEFGDTLSALGINLNSENINLHGTPGNLDIKRLNFAGQLHITKLSLNELVLDSLKLEIAGREGKMSVEEKSGPFFGGIANGKILMDFTKKPVLIQTQHQVKNLNIADFLGSTGNKQYLSGSADYNMEISFHSFNWHTVMKSMQGHFSLKGNNLELKGINIDKVLANFKKDQDLNSIDLTTVFLMGPVGAVFAKGMDISTLLHGDSNDITNISVLVSDWTINKGIAQTEDVAFSTDKYRLAANGGIDLGTDQFIDLTIAVLYKNGCAGISQTLNGLFVDYQSENFSKISTGFMTSENLAKILSKPNNSNCKPFYYGSVEHPE